MIGIGGDILREALGIPAPTTTTKSSSNDGTTTASTTKSNNKKNQKQQQKSPSQQPHHQQLQPLIPLPSSNYKNDGNQHHQRGKMDYNQQQMSFKSSHSSNTTMTMMSFPPSSMNNPSDNNNSSSLLGPFPLSSLLFSSNNYNTAINNNTSGVIQQVFGPPFPQSHPIPFFNNPPMSKGPGGSPRTQQQQQVVSTTSTLKSTNMPMAATPKITTTKTPSSKTAQSSQSSSAAVPIDMIDEMVMRFMMSIPEFEKHPVRSLFQVELAHWFFVDLYCQDKTSKYAHLASVPFEKFAELMFQRTPYLKSLADSYDIYLAKFKYYKTKVPTYGAILLDEKMDNVLLVQGFRGAWGFPKGKVNQAEDPFKCAIREVKEETGFDMGHLVNRKHFIESAANDRKARLYIATGVPIAFPFNPLTRFEIKNIAWFPIHELPECKNDPAITPKRGLSNSQFFAVIPFTKRLKAWIQDKKDGICEIDNFRCKGVNFDSSLFYGLMELPPDVLKAHPEWNYWNTRSDIANYDSPPLPFDSSTMKENDYQTTTSPSVNKQTRQEKNKLENGSRNNFNNGHEYNKDTSNKKLISKSPYQNQKEKKSPSTASEKRGNPGKSNEKNFANEEGLFKRKNNARRELFPNSSTQPEKEKSQITLSKIKVFDKNADKSSSASAAGENHQTLANLFTNCMVKSSTTITTPQLTDHFAVDKNLFKSPSWLNFKLDQEKINVAMNSS